MKYKIVAAQAPKMTPTILGIVNGSDISVADKIKPIVKSIPVNKNSRQFILER